MVLLFYYIYIYIFLVWIFENGWLGIHGWCRHDKLSHTKWFEQIANWLEGWVSAGSPEYMCIQSILHFARWVFLVAKGAVSIGGWCNVSPVGQVVIIPNAETIQVKWLLKVWMNDDGDINMMSLHTGTKMYREYYKPTLFSFKVFFSKFAEFDTSSFIEFFQDVFFFSNFLKKFFRLWWPWNINLFDALTNPYPQVSQILRALADEGTTSLQESSIQGRRGCTWRIITGPVSKWLGWAPHL